MKELVIKLRMDRSHAKASADAQTADNKKIGDAAVESAKRQKQAQKELLTDVQIAEKAKQKVIADTNKASVDAAAKAMKAQKEATDSHSAGLGNNLQAVGALISGYGSMSAVTQVVSAIGDMWKAQRKDIEDSVDRIAHYRDALLELAALKDRLGQSTPELQSQLEFRAKTLQDRTSAQVFQGGALNTGQAAMASGVINKAEFDKLMVLAGSYQAATNANPDALGNLTGMLPSVIGKQGQTADSTFQRMVGIFNIIQRGGSSLGSGIGQFANNSGLTQIGMFDSPEEQAAVQSYFSLKAPLAAGTRVDQFVRGTAGMSTRARGSPLEGSEKQNEYGARLGVTDAMKSPAIGRLIAADLKTQAANNKDFNAYNYLTLHGFTNDEAKMAVLDFAQGVNSGTFDKTFGAAASGKEIPSLAEATAGQNRFQAVDPAALGRKNALAKDLSDASVATGPEAIYASLKRTAFERLRSKGSVYGDYDQWGVQSIWGGQISDEVKRMLDEAGAKVGVSDPSGSRLAGGTGPIDYVNHTLGLGTGIGKLGGSPASRFYYTEYGRAKAAADFAAQIQDKGGSIDGLGPLLEVMRQQLEIQKKAEDRAAKGIGNMPNPAVPAPLRGAPPVPTRQP